MLKQEDFQYKLVYLFNLKIKIMKESEKIYKIIEAKGVKFAVCINDNKKN